MSIQIHANTLYVLSGCMVLGAAAGLIGSFTFLRKRSLIGDALAHAALPGICVAFMLTGTKDPLWILAGATLSCWLGAISIEAIVRHTRVKEDSALGMVLSVFFGVGILLLTHIQKSGNAAQAGLDKFSFGQAAAMVPKDVLVIGGTGLALALFVLLAYKELKVISFDPEFAAGLGIPRRFIEMALATMVVLAVAIGLQAVGVVLMAALLVTPAAAARYWTERLSILLLLAAGFGACSGAIGAGISYAAPQMPTGPWMVVAVTGFFAVSLLAAPRRGIAARLVRQWRIRRRTARENILRTLYVLGERDGELARGRTISALQEHRSMNTGALRRAIERLSSEGLVAENRHGAFALTEAGIAQAARLTRLHRLWELYLTRKLELAADHVHDDAEEIEHILTPELEARLIEVLGAPEADPHARPIPGLHPTEGRPA
jgi:manganese/zinc/iron transport system permease protein